MRCHLSRFGSHSSSSSSVSSAGRFLYSGLLMLALGAAGCAGQLKGAMVEHAHSTRSVADTIKKALESIKCDAAAPACATAVTVIEDQVKALQDGAGKLEASGRQ